ncbi:reverse transcriptase [Abeliophyllum distichum]|uniref:Reverse transcriptase n=1 Tax=Abeliophyllum distichum TaxID=126358 RepID=A0ABD1SB25_9LAMI
MSYIASAQEGLLSPALVPRTPGSVLKYYNYRTVLPTYYEARTSALGGDRILMRCVFGIASKMFLGYMVNQRCIEANLEKIKTVIEMRSLKMSKEVQFFTRRMAVLKSVSSVLILEEKQQQLSVYYMSKALLGKDVHYPDMEKLALTLITASRKLRPYLQAHSIYVLTNFSLRQVMQKPNASMRLLKWAVELSLFDIAFKLKTAIKGQALADFMVEFANVPELEASMTPLKLPTWYFYVDRSFGDATRKIVQSGSASRHRTTLRNMRPY